jgi:hypothetical protein
LGKSAWVEAGHFRERIFFPIKENGKEKTLLPFLHVFTFGDGTLKSYHAILRGNVKTEKGSAKSYGAMGNRCS